MNILPFFNRNADIVPSNPAPAKTEGQKPPEVAVEPAKAPEKPAIPFGRKRTAGHQK